jgi:hypothetical protein
LRSLIKAAGVSRPRATDKVVLSACAGRVFVEFKEDVAGIEALVLSDGAVTLPAKKFAILVKTYAGTKFLNLMGGPDALKIQNFTMPVITWNSNPQPPGQFQDFPTQRHGGIPPARSL